MRAVIVVFDGSNRQDDLARAIFLATNNTPIFVPARESTLPDKTDVVFLPGGFSYGDYLRSGAMAAKTPIMRAVTTFAAGGGRVMGICNGFQILCEAGLLSGLLRPNHDGRFICSWQRLTPAPSFEKLFAAPQVVFPIAHADGNFQIDDDGYKKLQDNQQILLSYDSNPNGARGDIAGICNKTKNIFGMMPHPENNIEDFHSAKKDGLVFFKNFLSM